MRTGKQRGARSLARGFTYLGLLALLAIQGAALAALGRHVSTAVQRDKEAELRFRGQQIRVAINSYLQAKQPAQYPARLDDLLVDERLQPPRHHLRQVYNDPFTGKPDWEELRDATGTGLLGVRSRSDHPRLATDGAEIAGEGPRVSDWQFISDGKHNNTPPGGNLP